MHKQSYTVAFVVIALCCSSVAFCQSNRGSTITLEISNPDIRTTETEVKIRDIVETYDGPRSLRQKIMDFELTSVPKGQSKTISASRLKLLVKLEFGMGLRIEVFGADNITIYHVDPPQLGTQLLEKLKLELAARYGVPVEYVALDISTSERERLVRFAENYREASWVIPTSTEFPTGSRSIELRAAGARTPHRAGLKLGLMQELVVAKQVIPSGQKISAADLEVVRRPIFDRNIRLATMEQAIGQTARSNIQRFSPLKTTSLMTAPTSKYAVKARQMVDAVYEFNGLSIRAQNLEAMRNGEIGEIIELRNKRTPQSRNPRDAKRIFGRVIDKGRVKIL